MNERVRKQERREKVKMDTQRSTEDVADNILDKYYEEIKYIKAPGRRWFIGLSWAGQ
jgi:outer membrane cobalamin receptor